MVVVCVVVAGDVDDVMVLELELELRGSDGSLSEGANEDDAAPALAQVDELKFPQTSVLTLALKATVLEAMKESEECV